MLHFNVQKKLTDEGRLSYRQDFKKDFFWYVGKLTLCVQHHYSDNLFHVFITYLHIEKLAYFFYDMAI